MAKRSRNQFTDVEKKKAIRLKSTKGIKAAAAYLNISEKNAYQNIYRWEKQFGTKGGRKKATQVISPSIQKMLMKEARLRVGKMSDEEFLNWLKSM